MMKKYAVIFLATMGSAHADIHTVPPLGVVANTNTQQLCVAGYTATIRPEVSYTNGLKKAWVPVGHKPNEYELDHYIPLALGGAPRDTHNLWLQTWDDAKRKDQLEAELHREVCAGKISLGEAQQRVTTWRTK